MKFNVLDLNSINKLKEKIRLLCEEDFEQNASDIFQSICLFVLENKADFICADQMIKSFLVKDEAVPLNRKMSYESCEHSIINRIDVEKMIDSLDCSRQRSILTDEYFYNLSLDEISEKMKESSVTVLFRKKWAFEDISYLFDDYRISLKH